jgi:lambda repressor-like predicted transcriptional regulator
VAAAAEIIRNYPDWSDRSVAATTGLSAATVKSVRERSRLPAQAAAKRLGLDGRMRPVNSGAGRKRVQELIEKFPTASLRQLAREAGVSPNTVRDVRRRMQQQETAAPEPARTAAAQAHAAPAENVNGSPVEAALRRLSQDPSLRLTESGRLAIRWFFSRIVRPREWIGIIGSLPPHTAFILAGLADQCAAEWQSLARSLRDQEHRSRPDQR